jgi:hypothetical protein
LSAFVIIHCRPAEQGASGVPLARADAPFTGDNCGNAGGLDQNIYGTSITFT